jgi:mannan endo-1,4-beta-mannosidase
MNWYPGDDKVDILGLDIYKDHEKGQHNSQVQEFKEVHRRYNGKKMIAMTENGELPGPSKLAADRVHWSWFCTWVNEKLRDEAINARGVIKNTFNHGYVLTLDEFKV